MQEYDGNILHQHEYAVHHTGCATQACVCQVLATSTSKALCTRGVCTYLPFGRFSDSHQHLASICSTHHVAERGARLLQAMPNVHLDCNLLFCEVATHVRLKGLSILLDQVADDEALHQQALGDDVEQVFDAVVFVCRAVVLADGSARDHAAKRVHALQRRLQRLPTDIVVVNVDAVRAQLGERLFRRRRLVVEGVVEANALQKGNLFVAACAADDAHAVHVGKQLANHISDGAGGARDIGGLALDRLAYLREGRVRGQARHAKRAQVGSKRKLWGGRRVQRPHHGSRLLGKDLPLHPREGALRHASGGQTRRAG
mmetsp:Transcript_6870/g.21112  ORF Transcript_6870/g.21112 Transcript_6870/m.21112 type:complete len:315 (-) Transcript_6870:184-1128(-)